MTDQRDEQDESALATVLETSDAATIAVAKSLLEASGIPYYAKGEQLQSLFGLGRIGGVNPICGSVELQVAAENYEKSLVALRDLLRNEAGEEEDADNPADES